MTSGIKKLPTKWFEKRKYQEEIGFFSQLPSR
jgi:hypothetical protein